MTQQSRQITSLLVATLVAVALAPSLLVLQELYAVLTRRFRPLVSAPTAARLVDRFSQIDVVQITPSIILAAIATHQRYAMSFWDALIVHAAAAGGAERVLSEDLQDGVEIEGVRIENPFRG